MNEKELIRRALMGDKQAQEECTAKGIVLPCPFCGEKKIKTGAVCGDYFVKCSSCGSTSDIASSHEKSLKLWNTRQAPPADFVPVIYAKWIDVYGCFETAECSHCHSQFEVTFNGEANRALWDGFNQFYKFCPNCGTKMHLKEE